MRLFPCEVQVLSPSRFRRRPEWPVVRDWLRRFPCRGRDLFWLSGEPFDSRPQVLGAIICPLSDGAAVLVGLGRYRRRTDPDEWPVAALVVGQAMVVLGKHYPLWSSFDLMLRTRAHDAIERELGPELARRVAYGEVTRAELEAELILRSLGGLS